MCVHIDIAGDCPTCSYIKPWASARLMQAVASTSDAPTAYTSPWDEMMARMKHLEETTSKIIADRAPMMNQDMAYVSNLSLEALRGRIAELERRLREDFVALSRRIDELCHGVRPLVQANPNPVPVAVPHVPTVTPDVAAPAASLDDRIRERRGVPRESMDEYDLLPDAD